MALVQAHQAVMRRIRSTTGAYVAATWDGLGSYDEEDVARFVTRVAPVVAAAQRQSAAVTVGYFRRVLGGPGPLVDLDEIVTATRGGVTAAEVYRRPFVTTWTALGAGRSWRDAVSVGGARARSAAETDVQLAFRDTASRVMQADDRVVGYQRVPSGNACELCLMASTQRYRSEDLMPIHNHCSCAIDPILGRRDPGHVIDRELLDRLKFEDADSARALVQERLAVHEHGELGPVLAHAGQHFDDL